MIDVKEICELHKIGVKPHPAHKDIDVITLENGDVYHLQHPSFMDLHEAWHDSESALLTLGLSRLTPETPTDTFIDEAYLNAHRVEGLTLWSPLLRGLLLQDRDR